MRKTSIKTLSFALSLLLVVTAICCLSFSVWAETEVVLGDLNGDAQISAEDIAILEAVLNGSQSADPDVNYDISGNKILDSDDLIVLKNMVDPSQPALADKLANGTTDDALCLSKSIEGGALQGAVVRGDSTKALEMDGNTLTIRFAEAQNWSNLSALSMDTLWVSGNQTITVSLLDADGNVLGTAGSATAEKTGWSSVVVSIEGVAAAQRKSVGGYVISTADDAQLYIDNLSLVEKELPTRAEMEAALVEIAWDWYLKGSAYEYDSAALNALTQNLCDPLCGYAGGKSRLSIFPVLENATSQSSVFTVCSGFAYDIYKSALGYPILGSKFNSLTMTFWRNSSYYPGKVLGAEGSYDMTVLRWHSKGQGNIYSNYDTEFSNYYIDENGKIVYNNWYTTAGVQEFFENYEENFRPGDIIVFDSPGHTVIYVGNGMVMDSNGSGKGKYDMTTGTEYREMNGTVSYRSFYDVFLNPDNTTMNVEIALGKAENHIVVVRPLNLLTLDDGDGDPSNDVLDPGYELQTGLLKYQLDFDNTIVVQTSSYGITEQTATRLLYPGMNIDRTVNITPYGTAVKGGTLTYSVKITNNSSDAEYAAFYGNAAGETYEDLWIVEHVPANTRLVSAPNATVNGNTLRWNVDVPAGQTVELTYTVRVTGEIGDTIVSGGGWVNNIPSNTIENTIGGEKLSDAHQQAMAGSSVTSATGTDIAEKIYRSATGADLQLPEVQELMDIFFSEYKYSTAYGYYLYYGSSGITRYMYSLNEEAPTLEGRIYRDMLVPGYYGGLWSYTDEYNGKARINELREEYLEVGDILVYMDLTPSTDDGKTSQTRVVEEYAVLVYLGNGTFASVDQDGNVTTRTDAVAYTEAFMHDLFLCLRPSQAYEDLSAGIPTYTVTWKDANGNTLETDDTPYGQVPTFDGAEPTKDGYTFAGWTPTVRPANADVTYTALFTRELTDSKLSDAELNTLAGITAQQVQDAFAYYALTSTNSHATLPWIYQQAGISVPTELSTNKIYATRNLLFTTSGGLAANASAAAPYTTMLVTNAYGGAQMKDGAAPEFEIGYLQIGDVFLAAFDKAQTGASATYYYTYLYQGNGNFLSISADSAVVSWEDVLDRKYNDTDDGWSYFFVIRPENYNGATRDIALRALTDAERYALSKLDGSMVLYPSVHLKGTLRSFYEAVGITMADTVTHNLTHEGTLGKVFIKTDGVYIPREATDDVMRYYQKMLLTCFGGSYFAESLHIPVSNAVADNILKTGDVVAGIYVDNTSTARQFTALYQDNDSFLVFYVTASGLVRTPMTASQIDTLNFRFYYTFRPEKQATVTEAAYTVTWVNDDGTVLKTDENVPLYTHTTYDGATPTKAPSVQHTFTFAGWTPVMIPVNGDMTYTAVYTEETRTYTVTWLNEDGSVLATSAVPYGTVPAYSGETPTKEGASGYTYTFEGWDKELTEVTGEATYTATFSYVRDITAHDLSQAELDVLANITPEDVKASLSGSNLKAAGAWIYQQANVDYSVDNHGLLDVYWMLRELFAGSKEDRTDDGIDNKVYYWTVNTSNATSYTTMLVSNAYGGTQVENAPEFDLDYLQIGDLFCAAFDKEQTGANSTSYVVYLYQGKDQNGAGKFLLMNASSAAAYTWEEVRDRKYSDTDIGWSYFYTIRPENYNGNRTRDIALRDLTDAEKHALSKLDNTVVTMGSMHLHTTLPRYFQKIGITMDMKSQTHDGTIGQLFVRSSSAGGRILVEATTDNMRYFQKMMVNCYGGTDFAKTSHISISEAIAGGILQIGDVIAGKYADTEAGTTASSFTALYQGNSMFLVQYHKYDNDAAAQTYQTVSLTAEQIDNLTFKYYFALRPSKLAIVSDDDAFTVTWANDDGIVLETDENVAVLTHPSYSGTTPTKEGNAQFTYIFAGWTPVMIPVNSDVTYTAVYSKTVNTYTVTWKDASGTVLETDEDVPYGTVPTYDGRRPFNKNEAVGFAGWDKDVEAVTGDVTYTATYTALRDMTTGGLTDAEKAAISSLTLADYSYLGSRNITNILPWVYKQAGIDITSAYGYVSTSHANMNKVFAGTSTAAQSVQDYYNKILVAGSHGSNVTGVGTDDLQIGDIFAGLYYTNLNGTSTTMYHTAVYLGKDDQGNDIFLDAYDKPNADGTGKTEGKVIATFADIEANHTEDDFTAWTYRYVLRPSQLSIPNTVTWKNDDGTVLETDTVPYGTVPTYDGATPTKTKEGYTYTFEGWDKEVVAATADVTYTATYSYIRTLGANMLTNEEMAALAAISPTDVQNAGLRGDNVSNVIAWIYQQANIDISDTVLGSKTINNVKGYLFTSNPLVPRTSSSSSSAESKVLYAAYIPMRVAGTYGGTAISSACVGQFNIQAMQIGDLLCAYDGSAYYVYLYQGIGDNDEGKFLKVGKNNSENVVLADIINEEKVWSYYFVIRPDHYNGRPMEDAPLTEAESYALSKLTINDISYTSYNLYGTLTDYYRAAGIAIDKISTEKKTHEGIRNQLFTWSESVLVPVEATTDDMRYYQSMQVAVQGGSNFAVANRVDISDAIDSGVLQTGDVVAGVHKNAYIVDGTEKFEDVPFTALYQGNDAFLVYYYVQGSMTKAQWTTEQVEGLNFLYYYTLRPENLAD